MKDTSNHESDANERILVRSTSWLGDAVMTLPALHRLRESRPLALIAVLTKPGLAPLFDLSGVVDDTIIYEKAGGRVARSARFLSLIAILRRQRFDTAILFQSAFEAALIVRLAGIPKRVGYDTQGRAPLLTHVLERPAQGEPHHETLDYLALVDSATGTSPNMVSPRSNVPAMIATGAQVEVASALLKSQGAALDGRPLILLNPGATNSEAKRWPETSFAELADRLARELNAQIALVGSASERLLSSGIRTLANDGPLNLAGLTDLPTLIGLASIASLVVTNDTGTAHISAALGRPTLTIFGPTNEFQTAPLGPRSEIIRASGVECERCMLRQCPIDHRCMTRISSDEAFSRAQRLLS